MFKWPFRQFIKQLKVLKLQEKHEGELRTNSDINMTDHKSEKDKFQNLMWTFKSQDDVINFKTPSTIFSRKCHT